MQDVWGAMGLATGLATVIGDAFGSGSPPDFLTAVSVSLAVAIALVAVLSIGLSGPADGMKGPGPRH